MIKEEPNVWRRSPRNCLSQNPVASAPLHPPKALLHSLKYSRRYPRSTDNRQQTLKYRHGYSTIAIAGGVSANSGVRESLQKACDKRNFTLYMPPLSLCGDNGAMIACAGSYAFDAGIRADSSLNASATMELTDWGNMGNGR